MVRIKYYRVINQSRFRWPYNCFHQSRFHFDAFSFPLCAYNLFVTLGNKIYIEFNYIKMYIRYEIVPICPYHFVHTILSHTIFSLYHFVHTILSATILSGHRLNNQTNILWFPPRCCHTCHWWFVGNTSGRIVALHGVRRSNLDASNQKTDLKARTTSRKIVDSSSKKFVFWLSVYGG